MCLKQKRFWIALSFILWCRQKELILRWKEKGRKRLKGGETCTCFLLNLFPSPKTKKIMPDRFVLCLAYIAIVRVQ